MLDIQIPCRWVYDWWEQVILPDGSAIYSAIIECS